MIPYICFYKKAQWSRSFTEYIPTPLKISQFCGSNQIPKAKLTIFTQMFEREELLMLSSFSHMFACYSFPLNLPLLLAFACKSIIQVELRPLACPWHPLVEREIYDPVLVRERVNNSRRRGNQFIASLSLSIILLYRQRKKRKFPTTGLNNDEVLPMSFS